MRKQYKSLAVFIMILGYFICITINSLLVSGVIYRYNSSKSIYVGKSTDYSIIEISSSKEKSKDEVFQALDILSEYGRFDVIQGVNEKLQNNVDDTLVELIPTSYKEDKEWLPPILYGTYFSSVDSTNEEASIVIGKSVAEKLSVGINDNVIFYEKSYKVIGILGSEYENTLWDNVAQIPINNLPDNYLDKFNEILHVYRNEENKLNFKLLLRVNQERSKEVINEIDTKLQELSIEIKKEEATQEISVVWSDIKEVVSDSLPILIVSIITISNISNFWIKNRKDEIAIKKVLGGTNYIIQREIRREVIVVGIISTVISFIAQRLLEKYLEPTMLNIGLSLQVSYGTFIVCFLITLFVGYISVRRPINLIVDMKPIEILTGE
ncbi:MAG: hypothetical protein GX275_08795 [Clostridiales bacterium]|nr:hypothetical protein [Clostridiales bacterium]